MLVLDRRHRVRRPGHRRRRHIQQRLLAHHQRGSGHGAGTTASSSAGHGGSTVGSSAGSGAGNPASSSAAPAAAVGRSSGSGCVLGPANADMDGDGWTPAQGDCNDCDPAVNPGAIDVPGDPAKVDHDCNGKYDPPAPCDSGLSLDDVDANDAAKAIELCQVTTASSPLRRRPGASSAPPTCAPTARPSPAPASRSASRAASAAVNPQGGQPARPLDRIRPHPHPARRLRNPTPARKTSSATAPRLAPDPRELPADDEHRRRRRPECDLRAPTNATGYSSTSGTTRSSSLLGVRRLRRPVRRAGEPGPDGSRQRQHRVRRHADARQHPRSRSCPCATRPR